ncbi:cell division cycle-associated protein 2 isoform X2 [Pseudophryne corroboree]|uniref:cell division cycle-associated protein 2 isoform X2 n=1 Tax=Pseudophryne corroboree TaxID=495146 RepID=UPI0030815146
MSSDILCCSSSSPQRRCTLPSPGCRVPTAEAPVYFTLGTHGWGSPGSRGRASGGGERVMATRKVLQEIPVLVPEDEQQSFQVVTEEETPALYNKQISPDRLHDKYISNDESKENIAPAEFENITQEEKREVTVPGKTSISNVCDASTDITDPCASAALGNHSVVSVSLQQESDATTGIAAGDGTFLTPRRDSEMSDQLEACTTPIDFSIVTVDDLGISSESLLKYAGKSPRSLRKYRRRSTIGVRGSPEMNFLIRQIALQKSLKKSDPDPLANPFTSPRNSVLRDKISAFRNVFQAVEEREEKIPFPGFSEREENANAKGEISEPPLKRKRICGITVPETSSISDTKHTSLFPSQPLENTQKFHQTYVPEKISETDGSLTSELMTDVSGKLEGQTAEVPAIPRSTRCQKKKVMFANLLSPPQSDSILYQDHPQRSANPHLRPVLKKTPRRDFRYGDIEESSIFFSLQESSDNELEENVHVKKTGIDSVKEKKRVTFGRHLSPEVFDRMLPANTPLRRGSTPCSHRRSDSGTAAAQGEGAHSPYQPLLQPDFDDQDEEEALQPLSLCFEAETPSNDSPVSSSLPGHNNGMMVVEDVTDGIALIVEDKPFSNDSAEEINTTVSASDTDTANETFIAPELDFVPAAREIIRSSKRKKPFISMETTSSTSSKTDASKMPVTAKDRNTSKKSRKPVIAKKAQIKSSRGKGKKGRGKPKKSVQQKPFYGERETVSKKPLLSPIPELPEYISTTPVITLGEASSKPLEKKVSKTRGLRKKSKGQPNNNGLSQEDSDHVVWNIGEEDTEKLTNCVVEPNQVADILKGSGHKDLKVKETESPTKNHDPISQGILDLVQQSDIANNGCPPSSADIEMKDKLSKFALVTCGLDTMTEDKTTNSTTRVVKSRSKRHFTSQKRESKSTSGEEHSEIAEMSSSGSVKQEDHADHGYTSSKANIDDPNQETNLLVLSPKLNLFSTEERIDTSTSIVPNDKKSRSSRNSRRSTIFCVSTELSAPSENLSAVQPHLVNDPASCTNEPYLSIDEVLQSTQREKKVRRSMRLRRDSGVGLSWVQENVSSEVTGRRKSLSSVVKRAESPKLLLENFVLNPNKENLSSQQIPISAKKSRRRTLGTTTLQESTVLFDTKRRRSNSSIPPAGALTSHNATSADT